MEAYSAEKRNYKAGDRFLGSRSRRLPVLRKRASNGRSKANRRIRSAAWLSFPIGLVRAENTRKRAKALRGMALLKFCSYRCLLIVSKHLMAHSSHSRFDCPKQITRPVIPPPVFFAPSSGVRKFKHSRI